MKFKTVALIVVLAIIFTLFVAFFNNAENRQVLNESFTLLGYQLSVIKCIALIAVISAVLPSLYFSVKWAKLSRHASSAARDKGSLSADQQTARLAREQYDHGRNEDALDTCGDLDLPDALLLRGRILVESGRPGEAEAYLNKCFNEHANPLAGYLLAQALIGQDKSPVEILRALIVGSAGPARRAWSMLLDHYDRSGMWNECIGIIKEMIAADPDGPQPNLSTYRYEWVASQEDLPARKAIEHYQQILKESPGLVPVNLALGETYLSSGAVEKAFDIFERAFEKTGNPVFLDRLEDYYLEQGRPEDAIQIYRQLLIRKGSPLIKFQLGKLYHKLEMLDESLEMLEPLRTVLGHIPGYLLILAELEARRERYDGAMADLLKLVRNQGYDGENFVCTFCDTPHTNWQARCDQCRQWDTINLEVALVHHEALPTAPLYY